MHQNNKNATFIDLFYHSERIAKNKPKPSTSTMGKSHAPPTTKESETNRNRNINFYFFPLVVGLLAVSWGGYTLYTTQNTALLAASLEQASLRAEVDRLSTLLAASSQYNEEQQQQQQQQQQPRLHELGIPLADLEHLGQLFMRVKVSQLLISEDVVEAMDAKSNAEYFQQQKETPYVIGLGVDLVSVPLDIRSGSNGIQKVSAKTAAAVVGRLDRWGVAVLQDALPRESCRTLANALFAAIKSPTYPFGQIIKPQKRKDYPLKLDSMAAPFLEEAARLIMPALKLAVGADAELVELSALMSMPGASEQHFHPDASMDKKSQLQTMAKVYSVFIYLDDVDPNMAPLDLMPATHTHYHFLDQAEQSMLETAPFIRMAVPCGTIVIMDSRIWHRGSKNSSPKARPTFYFSVMSKGGDAPEGPTYSIREGYKRRFTLDDIVKGNTLQIAAKLSDAPSEKFDAAKAALKVEADLMLDEDHEAARFKAAFAMSTPSTTTTSTPADNSGLAHPVMKPPVVAIATSNYTEEIQKHAYTFVCFFDPRSAAYKINKKEFENAAQDLKRQSDSKGKNTNNKDHKNHKDNKNTIKVWPEVDISFAAVNAARDSFLTNQQASELAAADQAPTQPGQRNFKSFEFGFPNFTPIIFHLFANGVRLREYQGVVTSSEILKWLQRMTVGSDSDGGGGRGEGHSAAAVATKRSKGTMLAVLCAPITVASTSIYTDGSAVTVPVTTSDVSSRGGDDDSVQNMNQNGNAKEKNLGQKDDNDGGTVVTPAVAKEAAFRNLSSSRPDLMDFVVLDSEASCTSVIGHEATYGDVYFVHKKYVEPANWTLVESFTRLNKTIATGLYQNFLEEFLSNMQAGSEVQQLTPDNSHVFLDRVQPVIIALFHPDPTEKKENDQLKRVLLKAVADVGRSNVQLTWANGAEFGPQFNIAADKKTLPTLLLVDTLTDPAEDTIRQYPPDTKGGVKTVADIKAWLNGTGAISILTTTRQKYWDAFSKSLAFMQNKTDAVTINASTSLVATNNESGSMAATLENKNVSTAAKSSKASSLLSNAKVQPSTPLRAWFGYIDHLETLVRYINYAKRHISKEDPDDYHGQQEDAEIFLSKASTLFGTARHKYPFLDLLVNTTTELEAIMSDSAARLDFRGKIETASRQGAMLSKKSTVGDEVIEADVWLKTEMGLLRNGEDERFAARTKAARDELTSQPSHVGTTPPQPPPPSPPGAASHVPEIVVQPVQIDRRDWNSLSLQEFYTEYALPKKPVVITNLQTSSVPWTLSHFRETCGNQYGSLKMRDVNTTNWGGLVDAEDLNIADFIDTHATNDTRRKYYLHDWSLPRHCPKVFGPAPYTEFLMPKYFAGDYFQRIYPNGYQHAWPSLFIGANATQSDLHIDSGGTHFWMQLLSGQKQWRFFDKDSHIDLYPVKTTSKFAVDVFNPDYKAHPLFARAKMYEAFQEPGDLMFIPANCPHAVRNLDGIHAISMNYVDPSNYYDFLHSQLSEQNWRAFELFTSNDLILGLNASQETISFGEFKSKTWHRDADASLL